MKRRKSRSLKRCRPLRIESLEQRVLLAGDVRAYVHRGDLIISGTDDDNEIYIAPGPTADSVILTPFPGTMINGQAPPNYYLPGPGPCPGSVQTGPIQPRVQLDGITGDWRINLRGGNNILTTTGDPNLFGCDGTFVEFQLFCPLPEAPGAPDPLLKIPDNLSVRFRNGSYNSVRLHSLDVGGNASIRAGGGFLSLSLQAPHEDSTNRIAGNLRVRGSDAGSRVLLNALEVGGDVAVTSGAGSDTVLVNGQVADDVTIRTGAGNDSITLGQLEFLPIPAIFPPPEPQPPVVCAALDVADRVFLELGEGDDEVHAAVDSRTTLIRSLGGDTAIELLESQIDRLRIQTDGGDDEVTFRSSEIGRAVLRTNAGSDRLAIDDTRFVDRAFFNLGDDGDSMSAHRAQFGRSAARLGNGDDSLNITCTSLTAQNIFDGGNGEDTAGGPSFVGPFTRNVEGFFVIDVTEGFCDEPLRI
jgi:hypothetical protein